MADVPDENAGFDDNERGDETGDETEKGDLNAGFDHDENDDETWHDCHDGSDAYLRLLFSSYCAAYTFFIAAWDTRNGEVPTKAGTSDAMLVLLGTNLNRRRKLIQRGYPDVPFINNLPCRLRSFNKGTRLSTRRLRR